MNVVLEGIEEKPGPVIFTLVDDGLREKLRDGCRRLKVPCISVLDPVIAALGKFLDAQPLHRIGGQHEMDAEYFQRIEAMDWALAHDDGQRAEEYDQSDVVLVGVSRTSKTPTCLYLANRGVKAANVPFVPDIPLPDILDTLEQALVIGLTNDPKRLVELRRARLALLQQAEDPAKVSGQAGFGIDTFVEGMLYGVLARPPAFGAKVSTYDEQTARKVEGVRHVVKVSRGCTRLLRTESAR